VTWGEEIEIDSQVARLGSKSFDVHYRITNLTTGEAVAEATETRVCIKLDPNRPKHIQGQIIPDDLRSAFNPGCAFETPDHPANGVTCPSNNRPRKSSSALQFVRVRRAGPLSFASRSPGANSVENTDRPQSSA
jgi:hypothetical protein